MSSSATVENAPISHEVARLVHRESSSCSVMPLWIERRSARACSMVAPGFRRPERVEAALGRRVACSTLSSQCVVLPTLVLGFVVGRVDLTDEPTLSD